MSLATTTDRHAAEAAGGGMELLLWILVWSELVVFGALLCAFLIMAALDSSTSAALHGQFDMTLTVAATVTLLTSGFFAARAAAGARPRPNLVLAALGGFAFCGLKIAAWLAEAPSPALAESRLFELHILITGFHFLHVFAVALLLLALAWRPAPRHVETVATIWHVVDLVWLLILPVIYLG